jgi:hypothetical protein
VTRKPPPESTPVPTLETGDPLGYLILTWDYPGQWGESWTGEVHSDIGEARESLEECSRGRRCVLARLVYAEAGEGAENEVVDQGQGVLELEAS